MTSSLPCKCLFTSPVAPAYIFLLMFACFTDAADAESPLKPAELDILRAQYEKEGDYVGVQTKFNYAWVRISHKPLYLTPDLSLACKTKPLT